MKLRRNMHPYNLRVVVSGEHNERTVNLNLFTLEEDVEAVKKHIHERLEKVANLKVTCYTPEEDKAMGEIVDEILKKMKQ